MISKTAQLHPKLTLELKALGKIAVLISGGTDSEVLLRASADVLGVENTFPFILVSQFQAAYYLDKARELCKELNLSLSEVSIDILQFPEIRNNTAQRCYHCKKTVYGSIQSEAKKHGITELADGTNLDDLNESRPGLKAASEFGIHHPFLKAELNKSAIRFLGSALGMADHERPADSCLATRIESSLPVSENLLSLIEKMEHPTRAEVKGRLRAKPNGNSIYYEHQAMDKPIVMAHYKELQIISKKHGYKLILTETT